MIIRCIEAFDGDIGFGFIDTADITSWRMIERNDKWIIQGLSTSNEMWVDICSYSCSEENAKLEFCEFIDNIIESELTGYPVEKESREVVKSEPYIKYWAKMADAAKLFDNDEEESEAEDKEFKTPCFKCSPGTRESCCGCPEYFDWQKKRLKEAKEMPDLRKDKSKPFYLPSADDCEDIEY